MADFVDSDVITEEFGAGVIPVAEPVEETVGEPEESIADETELFSPTQEVFSPAPSSKSSAQAAPDDATSLDNLRAVSSVFENGCKTLKDIVSSTGLSQSVVLACIKWLKDNELIAVSGSFYCTIDNVYSLQSQLKACQKCK